MVRDIIRAVDKGIHLVTLNNHYLVLLFSLSEMVDFLSTPKLYHIGTNIFHGQSSEYIGTNILHFVYFDYWYQ